MELAGAIETVKISNDMWLDTNYLQIPSLGKTSANPTWWLPSPITVKAGSTWTVEALGTSGSCAVILHLSYGPVYGAAYPGGTNGRRTEGVNTGSTTDKWFELLYTAGGDPETISDFDPSRKYLLIGASAYESTGNAYAVRLRADGFQGLTPIIPITKETSYGTSNMIAMLPEGMPFDGDDTIYFDVIALSTALTIKPNIIISQSIQEGL